MNFAEAAINEAKWTRTENGAVALNTSGDANLDFFGSIGSLRNADLTRVTALFEEAYGEDPLLATKILFYARDIRGGLGERKVFRNLIRHIAQYHPEALKPNLDLIGVFGRYDDLYCLIGTPLESDMWDAMKRQFEEDVKNFNDGCAVSLLAKWIKTADASSEKTRKLGVLTAMKLGYPVYNFKRIVRALRKHIGVVETLMSSGKWDEIKYSSVPSRAMMIYRNAFMKHDSERYGEYINNAVNGKEVIHSDTLYPYDVVEKILYGHIKPDSVEYNALEAQWRQLPDYVEKGTNALVIADTSGSMHGRPLASSVGLAIYFAERNVGEYHNMWMSFSSKPHMHVIKGNTLAEKIRSINMRDWDTSTDIKKAFELVIDIAEKNNVPADEMPKSLIVISDMEIDYCGNKDWTFYDKMSKKFKKHGYQIPNIIFWNVCSRHNIFHADSKRKGVQLCSGQSVSVFKQMLSCVGMTPIEAMMSVINTERYDCIKIG